MNQTHQTITNVHACATQSQPKYPQPNQTSKPHIMEILFTIQKLKHQLRTQYEARKMNSQIKPLQHKCITTINSDIKLQFLH